jgi:hypothetical protein
MKEKQLLYIIPVYLEKGGAICYNSKRILTDFPPIRQQFVHPMDSCVMGFLFNKG